MALSQFRGHPTILAFYPADFSPVCGDQMALYNEILPEFQHFNAELVGVSVDGVWLILHSPKIEISIFHYFQILNQKVKWQNSMAYIEIKTV
jgi:AhpC/TSA family